jgi:hypothetical protein
MTAEKTSPVARSMISRRPLYTKWWYSLLGVCGECEPYASASRSASVGLR